MLKLFVTLKSKIEFRKFELPLHTKLSELIKLTNPKLQCYSQLTSNSSLVRVPLSFLMRRCFKGGCERAKSKAERDGF